MSNGDAFNVQRLESQQRRANNRRASAKLLRDAGIGFAERNGGVHLIVAGCVDFWPGTGLWIDRKTSERRRGVRHLIRFLRESSHAGR